MGVDAVAFVAMVAAVILGAGLAAIVVAIIYAGGNVLEDFAVARAERDLKSLVDRAPRIAHLSEGGAVRDVAVDAVKVGDRILVRAGEIVPVDGVVLSQAAMIDESALTGEPIAACLGHAAPLNIRAPIEMPGNVERPASRGGGVASLWPLFRMQGK